jgi:F0F1-type ATP synthase membrane subunit c/vacuolar-type H+-ATPase subunit K
MMDGIEIIHFGTIALAVAINALGVGIGQGLTSSAALEAINLQPAARDDITKIAVLSMALIETAAVMGTFIAFILLLGTSNMLLTWHMGLAEIGIAFAICLPGFILGLASCLPARQACMAVARQPFFAQNIIRFMLIILSLIQTPIIFGMIIALFINNQMMHITTIRESLRLIASGIAIGFGSIGPAIGLAHFAKIACTSVGINKTAYNKLLTFSFVSQAIIETPIIFSFVIALTLLFIVPHSAEENIVQGIAMLAAGICTGIGTVGAGISSGKTAAQACKEIGLQPESYSVLSRTSLFAQGLIETSAIYAVLVSFLLLFIK